MVYKCKDFSFTPFSQLILKPGQALPCPKPLRAQQNRTNHALLCGQPSCSSEWCKPAVAPSPTKLSSTSELCSTYPLNPFP